MRWLVLCGFLFLGSVALVQATPPQGHAVNKVTIVDAGGKKVGTVFDFEPYATPKILFEVKGFLPFSLLVSHDRLLGPVFSFFTSSDCSGTPLVEPSEGDPVLPLVATGLPGNTVYFPDPSSSPQAVTYHSFFRDFDRSCHTDSGTQDLVATIPLIDLETLFTPPYHVK